MFGNYFQAGRLREPMAKLKAGLLICNLYCRGMSGNRSCIKSCFTIILKIPVSLAKKIKVKVDGNEDHSVSELQALLQL